MSDAWLDDFFSAYYHHHPVSATFIGVHDYDHLLPNFSQDGSESLVEEADRLLRSFPRQGAESLDHQLAEGFLKVQRLEANSAHFTTNPVHFTGESIFGLVSLLLRDFAPLDERLACAESRLRTVSEFLSVAEKRLASAPAAWIERARHECAGAHLLLEDVTAAYPRIADAASVADAAFARFDAFLAQDVQATQDYACGAQALELLLRHAHFSELDSSGIESLALEYLTHEEAFLQSTPPPDPERPSETEQEFDYLTQFQSMWQSACDVATNTDFLTVPDWPVRFVERPTWARRAAPYLYFLPYRSPAPFDTTALVEYLVPPGSDASTIKLNHVLHHASWGHHFQNWFAYHSASRIGRIAAVDCASRIAMLCGGTLAEGWANYAVDLAEEAGMLTPVERYGQHRARARMAARAIVDIRLHRDRLTLDESINVYTSSAGMSYAAARSEAVKNSLFPGAACMYLLGWHGIWQLRRQVQSRSSLRELHDRILSFGSVPVSLIARAMLARKERSADVQYATS
jgi:uncharacterized protein DUF885